ncbi:DNA-binding NarL/FixJ family response regulator [Haloferula luteola]|uniref:DNA-binding NarL/FixJ family response regulator n=1 Tax=Haloferula luteola TaxID=595692 RepID=A0A840UYC7_9BACT|nr:response regulator transcription factor [Haloferula luteola]MBB5350782.1 DNA-binding NarL/FixJ family response regulator [Haloferula luteola]
MNLVLIVEDLPASREWLSGVARAAFPRCHRLEADSVAGALELAGRHAFDLALIDLGLPDGSGLDLLRRFQDLGMPAKCVVTTVATDDATMVAALSLGAAGYLLKDQPGELLARQLQHLVQGIPALSPSVARRIMEHFQQTGPAAGPEVAARLTDREKEILTAISRGLRNAEVAENLAIAESTVASHIKAIYRKLGISNRAEAARQAARLGL